MTTTPQPPTEARERDSIEKIWGAFEKIWKRATNQDMPVIISIPANEDKDADCIMHRAILELETLRTTPPTREVLDERDLRLLLRKLDLQAFAIKHEGSHCHAVVSYSDIKREIDQIIAKQLEKAGLVKGGE